MKSRLIKPSFFLDERLIPIGGDASFFLVGLLFLADKEGRLEDRPLKIRAQIMPYGSGDGASMLDTLQMGGLISRGEGFIQVEGFDTWVSPFPTEKESLIPADFKRSTPVEHGSYHVATSGYAVATVKGKVKGEVKESLKKEKVDPLFPVRESKDQGEQDWYLEAVSAYPTKDEGHNARSGVFERRRVTRDSPQAQKNFHALVGSLAVTPRELYVCAWLATDEWRKKRDEYCYIPNLSSFYSAGEKSPWAAFIEDAREAIERMDAE